MPYDKLLEQFSKMSVDILKDNLVGIYLHGSATMGCLNADKSDIDLLLVVKDDICDDDKLRFMNSVVKLNEEAPAKGLEFSIIKQEVCKPLVYPTPFILHFSNMHLYWFIDEPSDYIKKMKGEDKDLAAHIMITNRYGQTIYGVSISEMFGEVAKKDYVDSIYYDIEEAKEDIHKNTMYIVLNLCRVLAYLKEELILSKKTGGEWGLKNIDARYSVLIKSALYSYESDNTMEYDKELADEYVDSMLNQIDENKKTIDADIKLYDRMLNKKVSPSFNEMVSFCGDNGQLFNEFNNYVSELISGDTEIRFPYGNGYGWCVTYRNKRKLICNVFAEYQAFTVMIRLTNDQFDSIYKDMSRYTRDCIDNRYPCNNGGWIHYRVTDNEKLEDIKKLVALAK